MGKKKNNQNSSNNINNNNNNNNTNNHNNNVKKLSQNKLNELHQASDHLIKLCFETSTLNPNEIWSQYIEIQETIHTTIQLIENELKSKTVNRNRSGAIEHFYKWLHDNGVQLNGVEIVQYPSYEFGLEATKNYKPNETFVIIPKKIIFSLDNVGIDSKKLLDKLPVLDTMPNVKLAIGLLVERFIGVKSFWKSYIDLLPMKYATVMNYTSQEMNELKGSSVFLPALNQCKNIARQYAFIRKALFSFKDTADDIVQMMQERFTYEAYCWAVSTIMTRQNSIPSDVASDQRESPADVPALIPLWDMANHCDGIINTSYNIEKNQIEGATMAEIKKGEQIFIHYGCRNNAELLLHNAFVPINNPSNSVAIRLGLSQSDPLLNERTNLLAKINISRTCELYVRPAPEYISKELLGFVRVFNMNEEQLKHWLSNDKCSNDLLYLDCGLDTEVEIKTWTFLKTRISLLLKMFPTTLNDDEQYLVANSKKGSNKLSHIKTMILNYRICEKKILIDALNFIDERIKI